LFWNASGSLSPGGLRVSGDPMKGLGSEPELVVTAELNITQAARADGASGFRVRHLDSEVCDNLKSCNIVAASRV
jgi:hypothetical protein